MDMYPVCLLVRLPRSDEYCHDAMVDSDVYTLLTKEGWRFVISEPKAGKPYLKMYRTIDGQFQQYWLHRYLGMGTNKCGHVMIVHHVDGSGLNAQCANLLVLHPAHHRQLHAQQKKQQKQEVSH